MNLGEVLNVTVATPVEMTAEERQMVREWIRFGLKDDLLGANWIQHCRNLRRPEFRVTPEEIGKQIRAEAEKEER